MSETSEVFFRECRKLWTVDKDVGIEEHSIITLSLHSIKRRQVESVVFELSPMDVGRRCWWRVLIAAKKKEIKSARLQAKPQRAWLS